MSPIYREMSHQKAHFLFRCRAEAMLRRAARLSNVFSTACSSSPKKKVLHFDLRGAR